MAGVRLTGGGLPAGFSMQQSAEFSHARTLVGVWPGSSAVCFCLLLFFFSLFNVHECLQMVHLAVFLPGSLFQDGVCIWFHVEITRVGSRPSEAPRAVLRARRETLVPCFSGASALAR